MPKILPQQPQNILSALIIIATCKYQKINSFSSPPIFFENLCSAWLTKLVWALDSRRILVSAQKYLIRKEGMMKRKLLDPDRIRKINGSFAFIEHRFLRDGFFETLTPNELLLYLFLTLVANKEGISWYPYDKICAILKWILDEYLDARNGLISKNLIAFDGYLFQVLDLPDQPLDEEIKLLQTQQDFEKNDPATIQNLISISWAKKI
jgi:hypothetical protein